ncbi:N-formylglutamate amidohydrolase [Candidatus Sodalis sp. SoCistrobi]|uniref:N-formylglutamate amidohydrolase n=1 Tax=Candidatus Sodalis sp. SoCistrobi TaxID=1922216 RepID=UPI00093E95A7|nr:N-formylglutamate amidohydrolase [Candidatus Sodalis sp. SoCistrobi]
MNAALSPPLLAQEEPQPVGVVRPDARSPFVILCDHAGKRIPRRLNSLGLPQREIARHIGWDIGALGVAQWLSARLKATLVHQRYSRLVIDCNRHPDAPSAIPAVSEHTAIPGNQALSTAQRAARRAAIFDPYHQVIDELLHDRSARGQPTCLIAMHSFTPAFMGVSRPWHIGVLYDRQPAYAREVLRLSRLAGSLVVGDNQPYVLDDTDYAIPVYAYSYRLPYAEIEIRQDLIGDIRGQRAWTTRLAHLLPAALRQWRANGAQVS